MSWFCADSTNSLGLLQKLIKQNQFKLLYLWKQIERLYFRAFQTLEPEGCLVCCEVLKKGTPNPGLKAQHPPDFFYFIFF